VIYLKNIYTSLDCGAMTFYNSRQNGHQTEYPAISRRIIEALIGTAAQLFQKLITFHETIRLSW